MDGGPRRRDREATRASILEAAEQLFAAQGCAATSLSQVAERCGVTKSLIHHYFRGKEQLWREVRDGVVARFAAVHREIATRTSLSINALLDTLEAQFLFLQRNPRVVRLIGWTLLDGDASCCWLEPSLTEPAVAQIRHLQDRGVISRAFDPTCLVMHLFSVTVQYFESRREVRRLFTDLSDSEADALCLDSLKRLMLAALAVPGIDSSGLDRQAS